MEAVLQTAAMEKAANAAADALDAQRATARWTMWMAIATALLAVVTCAVSVLAYLDDDAPAEAPPVVLPVAVPQGSGAEAEATFERRIERSCRHADFVELYRADGTFADLLQCGDDGTAVLR